VASTVEMPDAGVPGMVRIPGGTFSLGAKDGEVSPTKDYIVPPRSVTLKPYRIDITEVTAGAYGARARPVDSVR
jgi:formylglycine-generating enzyme required for sulfatase activity